MGSLSQAIVLFYSPYFYDIYNVTELRLGALTLILALLAMASYAERSGDSTDIFFIIAVVLLVFVILVVAVNALFQELRDIMRERKGVLSNVDLQRTQLIRHIRRVLPDLDDEFQT